MTATLILCLMLPLFALRAAPSQPAADGSVDARTEPPVIIVQPGPEFQDERRPGAMIIGMDRTPKGRIWGCWTGTGDKSDGYFLLATSDDGGATWSKPRLAVGAPDPSGRRSRGALVGNLWTDPLGRLWLFFDQATVGVSGPRADWLMRCDNPDADAPTWSKPVCFAEEGCTLNKPTVLKNGEWLLPVSKWADKTAWVYVSTDQGQSWNPRGRTKFPDWNFDEHMFVELKDGRLWMLARTGGNPYETFSSDGGATWSEPAPAASVQNVNARFFLRQLASGRILLVKNGPPTERIAKRSHMSAYLSDDDGKTWKGGLLLDERSSVSYPDGFQAPDGLIHILYDWNRHSDAEILLAKFREEDVLAGKLVSKDAKLQLLANKATGPKPVLYNGIELPLEWPPRHLDPASAEPMPVPYQSKRSKASIPIDLGRQLFVDDFLIESTTLKRVWHPAEPFAGNPVLQPEALPPLQTGACSVVIPRSDGTSVSYNPFRKKWVFSIRSLRNGLTRDYWESDDFPSIPAQNGPPPVFWAAADKFDRTDPALGGAPQLNALHAIAYESLTLGLFEITYGPSNQTAVAPALSQATSLQVAFSRDGFHWSRGDRKPFIAASRKPGDWDCGRISSAGGCCLVVGDKLHFYYGAFQSDASRFTGDALWSGPCTNTVFGLATLRRDGFASMDAGEKPATLTTRPVKFSGEHLFVNYCAPHGELRVEVLTLEDKNYGPFTAEKCEPLTGDSTRQRVTWRGAESLARASNKNVKLRFTLTRGSLYAFWITSDPAGASGGHVAAGPADARHGT